MNDLPKAYRRRPLFLQLCWFIRLRWIVGATIIGATAIDHFWLDWYRHHVLMLLVGVVILIYNALMRSAIVYGAGAVSDRLHLLLISWVQICLDLGCLTLLTALTGGVDSPLLGFFVFHMIFASLLLPRFIAYGGAAVAVGMMLLSLRFMGQWSFNNSDNMPILTGWGLTLFLTVYLNNRITRSLRRQRRRLIRQNRHIRQMTRRLRQHQQALIQQEKMVAMGQMAAGVTHEIANPLASMDSLLQLIQRKPERATQETVATLREQVGRINQIIRQMTTFAHPTDGQWNVMSVNDVVETALQMVRFDQRLRQVRVRREFSPDAGEVRLVPQAIQQVLVNLILNALDAMAEVPEAWLTLRTKRDETWCVIEVADNGHGIPDEIRDRLFEPFFTTKPVGKGTGLGLSISDSLIRKQGGMIEAISSPDGGACFVIRLPVTNEMHSRNREASS